MKEIKNLEKAWEEIRLCANLIKSGKAKIVKAVKEDGTSYRYTKVIQK